MPGARITFVYLCMLYSVNFAEECWSDFGESEYIIMSHHGAENYNGAVRVCQSLNASLASIHSAEEHAYIDNIREQSVGVPVWIGMKSFGLGLVHLWTDETPTDYLPKIQRFSQPLDAACLYLYKKWYEGDCRNSLHFVCKRVSMDTTTNKMCPKMTSPFTTTNTPVSSQRTSTKDYHTNQITDTHLHATKSPQTSTGNLTNQNTTTDATEKSHHATITAQSPDYSAYQNIITTNFASTSATTGAEGTTTGEATTSSMYKDTTTSEMITSSMYKDTTTGEMTSDIDNTESANTVSTTDKDDHVISQKSLISSSPTTVQTNLHELTSTTVSSTTSSPTTTSSSTVARHPYTSRSLVIPTTKVELSSVEIEEKVQEIVKHLKIYTLPKRPTREAPGGEAIGAIALLILIGILGGIVLLDLVTIEKHINFFLSNIRRRPYRAKSNKTKKKKSNTISTQTDVVDFVDLEI